MIAGSARQGSGKCWQGVLDETRLSICLRVTRVLRFSVFIRQRKFAAAANENRRLVVGHFVVMKSCGVTMFYPIGYTLIGDGIGRKLKSVGFENSLL
jgi:hypothetical protein